jgi:hypothetical protein
MALLGDVAMGAGILGVGVGVVLLATSGKRQDVVGVRRVVPVASPHAGYLLIQGGF